MNKLYSAFLKWQHSYLGFVIIFLVTYLLLYYFNISYIGICAKGGLYSAFLDQHLNYIKWWRYFSIESTATVIECLGYKVRTSETVLGVFGRRGITLIYSCLGYEIMAAFTAFLIAFPRFWKSKLKFWAIGILMIQALNIVRFAFLALYWNNDKTWLGLNHHDLFNIFIYLVLMLSVYIWLNTSLKNESNPTQKSIR